MNAVGWESHESIGVPDSEALTDKSGKKVAQRSGSVGYPLWYLRRYVDVGATIGASAVLCCSLLSKLDGPPRLLFL